MAFNGGTAALAEIDVATLPRFQRLLRAPETAVSDQDRELLAQMQYARFLCADDVDEVEEQRQRNDEQKRFGKTFFMTIAPTLGCNFRCDYCFQAAEPIVMSESTANALLEYTAKRVDGCERMMVTWFGGEPTLCPDRVVSLQERLNKLCLEYDLKEMSASLISNGYSLDGTLAERFKEAGITEAQITIDGPAEIHDRRRKLRSGRGTLDRILANLEQTSQILRIVIRINVDCENAIAALKVVELLETRGLLNHVNIYFAPVNNAEGVCADVAGRCLSTKEFAATQVKLYGELVRNGFKRIEYPMIAPGGYCGAGHERSFVVAPNGLLFKCWEELSCAADLSVGSLFDESPTPQQQRNLDRYRNWDPFAVSGCRDCSILPLCLGGCPKSATSESVNDHGYCSPWKYNLGEMLTLRYLCNTNEEVEG